MHLDICVDIDSIAIGVLCFFQGFFQSRERQRLAVEVFTEPKFFDESFVNASIGAKLVLVCLDVFLRGRWLTPRPLSVFVDMAAGVAVALHLESDAIFVGVFHPAADVAFVFLGEHDGLFDEFLGRFIALSANAYGQNVCISFDDKLSVFCCC